MEEYKKTRKVFKGNLWENSIEKFFAKLDKGLKDTKTTEKKSCNKKKTILKLVAVSWLKKFVVSIYCQNKIVVESIKVNERWLVPFSGWRFESCIWLKSENIRKARWKKNVKEGKCVWKRRKICEGNFRVEFNVPVGSAVKWRNFDKLTKVGGCGRVRKFKM